MGVSENEKWRKLESDIERIKKDLSDMKPTVKWVSEIRIAIAVMGRLTKSLAIFLGLIISVLTIILGLIALGVI